MSIKNLRKISSPKSVKNKKDNSGKGSKNKNNKKWTFHETNPPIYYFHAFFKKIDLTLKSFSGAERCQKAVKY